MLAPLKNLNRMNAKYANKIEILAFGYASVLISILGNVTLDKDENIIQTNNLTLFLLIRKVHMYENHIGQRTGALQLENRLAQLRFVSCGSRGLEPLQFEQFFTVFENSVWKCILATTLVLLFAMSVLNGGRRPLSSSNKIIYLLKVFLEQGDPFPEKITTKKCFRFLLSGILLGSLVLSNAFKSTNVYNIVLPQKQLIFRTIDQLLEHGYVLYSKVGYYKYYVDSSQTFLLPPIPQRRKKYPHEILVKIANVIVGFSWTEIKIYGDISKDFQKQLKEPEIKAISKYVQKSRPHPNMSLLFVEPFEILRPLLQIGLMSFESFAKSVRTFDFWGKQDAIILEDLKKCNKSAWIMPNYKAQQLKRVLYQSGKHSDIGVGALPKSYVDVVYRSHMPSSILLKTSLVSNTGLLDFWSNLINRTDLVGRLENEPPKKPNMSGNIKVIFVFLVAGLLISLICMFLELHGSILRIICEAFKSCHLIVLCVIQKCKRIYN
jgi:hypothetical protein